MRKLHLVDRVAVAETEKANGEETMSSENEVSILMHVLKLICSSSSCGNAFKSFLNGNRHFRDE